MQQQEQGAERCDTQENSCPESQDNTSDEIAPDVTSSHEEGNDSKESELETPATTPDEVDGENGINDGASSDPPSSRSKTSRSAKKRHNKIDKGDIETVENAISEGKHDNGFSESNITSEEESTPINEVTKDEEDDVQDIVVEEEDETIVLQTSCESSHAEYTVEFPLEDGNKEETQHIVVEEEEEISISTSVLCEDIDESEGKCSEASEKYLLTLSSSEVHQFTPVFDGQENTSISENLSVSVSSLGGGIRSISARKPMRKSSHFVMHGRSSVSTERAGTDRNYSDTDCSVDTTEGSTVSSQKRKACDVDTINSKKQKLNNSKNSKFFSMVSSPLRMLKSKLSDRIVESLNTPCSDDLANGNNENEEDDDVTTDKINVEGNEIKEKSLCVVSNEVTNQNSMYRSWCSIM
ncbi:hypothetical protein R5R35_005136 [Gryllus longicercus]|uniref:Uncharacterized protein n=1 Tax=Gryllus longicercus TaxID=2509291 RepID=A0AAN9VBX4_9ORTH